MRMNWSKDSTGSIPEDWDTMPKPKIDQNARAHTTISNWKAFSENQPWLESVEFPLLTDAAFTGELTLGPYAFINTVATSQRKTVKPAVVLRYAVHRKWDYPDFSETDSTLYHGGGPAEELAALASLCMGVRLRAGRLTRRFEPHGDPFGRPDEMGDPIEPYFVPATPPLNPNALTGPHPLEELSRLSTLLTITNEQSNALIRSSRLYQEALWACESDPAMSWLLLVSAVEVVANAWMTDEVDNVERLQGARPSLYKHLEEHGDRTLLTLIADEFASVLGATQKFVKFCLTFIPPTPPKRPSEWAQVRWTKTSLRSALSKVYDYRSQALHSGKPFPAPMCTSPGRLAEWDAPAETLSSIAIHQGGSTWLKGDIPMHFHIFEYIARNAILNWWQQL